MSLLAILFLAVGLAMDAFAVSVASGFAIKELRVRHAFRVSAFFGGFQAIMPVLGWSGGLVFRRYIESYDHWVAFGLLTAIGVKMIVESFEIREEKEQEEIRALKTRFLLVLAVATSLDALAVGMSLSLIRVDIIGPALIIGIVTFVLCFAGVYVGRRMGHFFENKLEIAAGLLLIGIGVKTLLSHCLT